MSGSPLPDELSVSFGRVVDDYDRGRPGYPDDAVELLVGDATDVVDVGAGTGKLTERLVGRGRRVVAIDPSREMLVRLRRNLPEVAAACGRAEALPLATGAADAVTVAQAYHWFDKQRAIPELARVLRPGGFLGIIWNFRDDSVAWVAELSSIIGSESMDADWSVDVDHSAEFADLVTARFPTSQELDGEHLLALVRSRSYVATLDTASRDKVIERVQDLVRTHPQLRGRSSFEMPYRTHVFRALRV